jgi:uncharacterized lipoprotein YmbA
VKSLLTGVSFLSLLCACVTGRPDHFYILSAQPPGASSPRTTPATQMWLRVALPSLVDRSEMIIDTSANGVIVLEHERWAAPLADLVTQTLARDIERRRNDILVAGESVRQPSETAVRVTVDLVQMTVRQGERALIEAHWRIADPHPGGDMIGSEVFSAPLARDDYAAVPQALSDCLGLLADRLVGQMR